MSENNADDDYLKARNLRRDVKVEYLHEKIKEERLTGVEEYQPEDNTIMFSYPYPESMGDVIKLVYHCGLEVVDVHRQAVVYCDPQSDGDDER